MKVRGGSRGGGGANVVYSPAPGALAPAALVLLRGQADGIDADPGNRVPERDKPEGAAWEPLYRALDAWDTQTIVKWIGPQGWVAGGMARQGMRVAATMASIGEKPNTSTKCSRSFAFSPIGLVMKAP